MGKKSVVYGNQSMMVNNEWSNKSTLNINGLYTHSPVGQFSFRLQLKWHKSWEVINASKCSKALAI